MKCFYLLALLISFSVALSAHARITCPANYHAVSKTHCCPVGSVLNKKNQCVYPTKNGCPKGFHPEKNNTCCPGGAVLTDDGMCTDYSFSSADDDYSGGSRGGGGGNVSIPHPQTERDTRPPPGVPAFYPQDGTEQCPYAQCSCQSGAQFGNVIGQGAYCN